MVDHNLVRQVKQNFQSEVMSKPNVIGLGTGYKITHGIQTDELCLVVLVTHKLGSLEEHQKIPRIFDDVRTDVIQVGELRALINHRSQLRPAPGGVSIGHFRITAGTFGVTVRDRQTGTRLILSNNHVLANSNEAQVGDLILQPGAADGGRVSSDTIANLERFVPIQFTQEPGGCSIANLYVEFGNFVAATLGSQHRVHSMRLNTQAVNLVDAALARPTEDSHILDEILEIGKISGTMPAQLGMQIRKFGRTTELTSGVITVMDATVNVNYGSERTATFDNQLVAGAMSQGGDSGSLIVDGNLNKAVGLLFAGSDQATIFNPIENVLKALDVEL